MTPVMPSTDLAVTPNPLPQPQQTLVDSDSALRERYRMEFTQFYDVWKVYMQWYTVFLTFNVAALVFYKSLFDLGSQQPTASQFWPRFAIGSFFLVQDTMATVTSLLIARFSRLRSRYLEELSDTMLPVGPVRADHRDVLRRQPLVPSGLTVIGASFNAVGAVLLAVIWILITPWR